jgi:myo-inositol 2-dehydrogenase / D-chiro-inositol 1-dehydrogenase
MPARQSRRTFLKASAAAAVGWTILPRRVLGGPGHTAPNEELTKAVIGVGGMGRGHLGYAGRLVAVCDVDRTHVEKALEGRPGVRGYNDFRELLLDPGIDIVHIATPDHWHAPISIAALQAGKDVWCEKPMTHTIGEGIRVVEAVRRYGRVFRINTWFRFQSDFYGFGSTVRPVRKLVMAGAFGWPLKVVVGAATGFNWKGGWNGQTNLVPQEPPPELDYDFWLGPAPWKPYNVNRVHAKFRGYWDYSGGGLADMGQHYLDPVQYILGKDGTSPVEIEADAPLQHPDATCGWDEVRLKYADGCEIVLDGANRYADAPFIEGPGGKLFKGFTSTIPDVARYAESLPDPEPQVTEFAESVRTRRKFALNEENGFRSCTLINLSLIAIRLGRPLRFDPVGLRFIGDDEANRLIHPPARAPWNFA